MKKLKIYMLVWLPASWKSTFIKNNANEEDIVLSSDALRKELFGDENNQSGNWTVFSTLHKRLGQAVKDKKNIYLDATNVSPADRRKALNIIRQNDKPHLVERIWNDVKLDTFYDVIAIVFNCDTDTLISRDVARERTVGEHVIFKMLTRFMQPTLSEWFSEIIHQEQPVKKNMLSPEFYQSLDDYIIWIADIEWVLQHDEYLEKSIDCEQKSQWHQETLLEHLDMIWDLVTKHADKKDLKILRLITLFHDIWKPFTRNKKSENLLKRWYTHIWWTAFTKKNGTKVDIVNYDDYQFIGHENFGANIFRWNYKNEFIKKEIITKQEADAIEIIIQWHLEFHMNEGKSFIILSGVKYDQNTELFRLGTLFSFCDWKGRVKKEM